MKARKTQKRLEQLWDICQKWADETQPSCAEAIGQSDRFIESAYDLMDQIAEVVGYRNSDD